MAIFIIIIIIIIIIELQLVEFQVNLISSAKKRPIRK